jgi:hypothetical protein
MPLKGSFGYRSCRILEIKPILRGCRKASALGVNRGFVFLHFGKDDQGVERDKTTFLKGG